MRTRPLLTNGTPLYAIFDTATALERAEASARVLAARANGHGGAPRAFAELAAIAPEGLIPTPGRGATHVARQVERAADIVAGAAPLLGDEIVDAVDWAAGMIRRIAATSAALDPAGAARATRRGVATIRGLMLDTIARDERWDAFRLGTHLPRAAWISALVRATIAVADEMRSAEGWAVVGAVLGLPSTGAAAGVEALTDREHVTTVGFALDQTESALLGLQRRGQIGTAPLALAREAQARTRAAAAALENGTDAAAGVDRLLDGIGALAGAIDPRVAEPGVPPSPWLRSPHNVAAAAAI